MELEVRYKVLLSVKLKGFVLQFISWKLSTIIESQIFSMFSSTNFTLIESPLDSPNPKPI